MWTLKFKRFYDMEVRVILVDGSVNASLSSIKTLISRNLRVDTYHLDIAQNCKIRVTGDDISINETVDVIVHENRIVPFHLQTSEPDNITFETDQSRAKMSCGHAFTADNLYSCCLSQLNDRKTDIKCPCCSRNWPFIEVIEKACLSKDERSFFEQRINLNVTETLNKCPMCMAFCERLDQNNPIVECYYCKKSGKQVFEFCWNCCQSLSGRHLCPNLKQGLQDQLQHCQRITMEYNHMENVPKVRACPKCSNMIEHNGGCKTMTCKSCNQIFCFCCLKLAVSGRLPCGNHSVVCTVSPIQII